MTNEEDKAQPAVGDVWRRRDGRRVWLKEKRANGDLCCVPLDGGRKSWKWKGGIRHEMTFVGVMGHYRITPPIGDPIESYGLDAVEALRRVFPEPNDGGEWSGFTIERINN